jgi:GDP-4-dehydro-6-deoxy-D-mannose reductase
LAAQGWTVVAVSRQPLGVEVGAQVRQVCDVLDPRATRDLVASTRPGAIVHLAGQSSVARSLTAPSETLIANTQPLVNLLEACRWAGLDPLIVTASSAEVYGDRARGDLALRETDPPRPLSPYAVSKVAQELLGQQYRRLHGLRVVALRAFNHIGPGQRPGFALPDFARQIVRIERGQQAPRLSVGNLAARRDFLDVRDVARAYLAAIERGQPGAVYNVGSGQAHAVRDVLDLLLANAQGAIQVEVDPARLRPVDIPLLLADARAFRAATGWRPTLPLAATARAILDDWRQRLEHDPTA